MYSNAPEPFCGPGRAPSQRIECTVISLATHKACLVDLDGTLYRARPLKLMMALEIGLLGLPATQVLARFRKEHEAIRELAKTETAEAPFELQLMRTAQAVNKPLASVRATVTRWMFERPCKWIVLFRRRALLAELAEFQAAGGKLALVSDYPARTKLQALLPYIRFDAVVANGEENGPRRLKPDPEGYLLAAERLAVKPAACLVIGDRADADGKAAVTAGMSFRWIR
jgi:FMN phosphatase YigB (HAD superfamily)